MSPSRAHEIENAVFDPVDIEPAASGVLKVRPPHHIYWYRHGRPDGRKVLLVHGGPGTGMTGNLVRLFDLERFDVVSFDQRGCGRSAPFGRLVDNDPDAVVSDIEALRRASGIDRWMVVGGSWGSTVALAYAAMHPERVERLVLFGTWLFRPADVQWYLHAGRTFLPEAWTMFADAVGYKEGEDLLERYADRLFDPDPQRREAAAVAWKAYERRRRSPGNWRSAPLLPACAHTTNMARIMVHFLQRYGVTGKVDLLAHVDRFASVPGTIIHGRYDLITPFEGAHTLAGLWTEATLVEIPDAGHTIDQLAIRDAVTAAIRRPDG